jgi:hypothetical protein
MGRRACDFRLAGMAALSALCASGWQSERLLPRRATKTESPTIQGSIKVRAVRTVPQTPEQRCADVVAAQEFHQIKKFVAACRQQWPGAKIVLRPNEGGPPEGARAPPKS